MGCQALAQSPFAFLVTYKKKFIWTLSVYKSQLVMQHILDSLSSTSSSESSMVATMSKTSQSYVAREPYQPDTQKMAGYLLWIQTCHKESVENQGVDVSGKSSKRLHKWLKCQLAWVSTWLSLTAVMTSLIKERTPSFFLLNHHHLLLSTSGLMYTLSPTEN